MEPLVITGLGLNTSLGLGTEANWVALCAGKTGMRLLTSIDVEGHPIQKGGEAPELPGGRTADDRRDRAHAYLRVALHEAMGSAGLGERVPDPERTCLILGSRAPGLPDA